MMRDKKEEEEELGLSPFAHVDKSTVLQEARMFNALQLDHRKCSDVIVKLLYLLNQGETFIESEAVELFFGTTKLFQAKDDKLRKLTYLLIKELSGVGASESIIVVASLTKDMNSQEMEQHKPAAIRVLCRLIDSAMLQQLERHLKQSIVSSSASVSSAALVSALFLARGNGDIVRRWSSEVYDAITSKHPMTPYLALGLYHELKQNDRQAISKMVFALTKYGSSVRSVHAHCLLVKYTAKVLDAMDPKSPEATQLFDYLEGALRHRSEAVIFEAARALCSLKGATTREVSPAVSVLQLFLNSPKSVLRFAAVRTLNKVAMTHPTVVATCNTDFEQLITDSNRSVATLAITTLLKTGAEFSVDRLMKQISSFMSDISDEFKVVVVDAVRSLCLKFPKKHRILVAFLSSALRDEGGYDFKRTIVDAIIQIMNEIPEAFEVGLPNLAEFIEDCEFTSLSCQVLHLIGERGPSSGNPARYIRYLYNRVILENATIRASAIAALAKFGARVPSLRPSVTTLIRRSLTDADDEVRDRALYFLAPLEAALEKGGEPSSAADADSTDPATATSSPARRKNDGKDAAGVDILTELALPVPLSALERELDAYLAADSHRAPFELANVSVTGEDLARERRIGAAEAKAKASALDVDPEATAGSAAASAASPGSPSAGGPSGAHGSSGAADTQRYAAELNQIPAFAALGKLVKSSAKAMLTESETEYAVSVIKHVFPAHIVLQFDCTNTLDDQLLEGVSVAIDADAAEGAYTIESVISAGELRCGVPGVTYTCLSAETEPPSEAVLPATLKFIVKDVDPATGEPDDEGYEDEYQIEDVEIGNADFIVRSPGSMPFSAVWESIGADHELVETFVLSQFKTIEAAVKAVVDFLGMAAHDDTAKVNPKGKAHKLRLSGLYMGEVPVAVSALFATPDGQITMELSVRSGSDEVTEFIASAVG